MTTPLGLMPGVDPMSLPDHKQLPCSDGKPVNNDLEHPQSALLTESLRPRLLELPPDGRFMIGEDVGICYRCNAGDPFRGRKSPDWFFVPGVAGPAASRGSYVLWRERVPPLLVVESAFNGNAEELDATPYTGAFWAYEQGIGAAYYVVFQPETGKVVAFERVEGRYHSLAADANGRYVIPPLRVALGTWEGMFRRVPAYWLRAWDVETGAMFPSLEEQVASAKLRALEAKTRSAIARTEAATAESKRHQADIARFSAMLRAVGIDPDTV